MSVEILNGSTIFDFVEDEKAFNVWVCDQFKELDSNQDGFLSYNEMLKSYGVDSKTETEEPKKRDGSILDLEEFREETKKMMVAMAEGIGLLPMKMVLDQDSFLKKAVDRECAKLNG